MPTVGPLGRHVLMRRLSMCFVVLVAMALGGRASACTCDTDDDVHAQLERAELVFFGRVALHHDASVQALETRYWEFEVQGVWKGPAQRTLRLYAHSPNGHGDRCDREFEIGQSYLVFARTTKGHPGRYRAQLCSGTVRADAAVPALRAIGRPTHGFK